MEVNNQLNGSKVIEVEVKEVISGSKNHKVEEENRINGSKVIEVEVKEVISGSKNDQTEVNERLSGSKFNQVEVNNQLNGSKIAQVEAKQKLVSLPRLSKEESKSKIIEYAKSDDWFSSKDIQNYLNLKSSRVAILLLELVEDNKLIHNNKIKNRLYKIKDMH